MDRTDGETFTFRFTTRAFATGIPTALAGGPVLSAMEDAVDTPFTTGVSFTASSVVGLNLCTIDASQVDFEAGKEYDVYISTGTVGGVSVIGEVVGHFSLSREASAVDLANVTDGLGALKAETALIVADTGELQTDWVDGGRLDLIQDIIAVDTTTDIPALIATAQADLDTITGTAGVLIGTDAANVTEISDAVWDEDATGHQSQGTFGQAIGDPVADATTIYQSVATDATGDNVAIDVVAVKAETVLILDDTSNLAVAGSAVNQPTKDSPGGFVITLGENEANTEDSTKALDGTTHDLEAALSGTEDIDCYYIFDIGSGIPVTVTWNGYLDRGGGAAKNITVQAENVDAASWRTIGTIQSGVAVGVESFNLFIGEVGTGANIGLVHIRFLTGSVAFTATTKLITDQIFVSYAQATTALGFVGGAVWFDDVGGEAGTGTSVGTISRPSSVIADAQTIAAANNLKVIHCLPGSTFTMGQAWSGYEVIGEAFTIALGSQAVDNTIMHGATVAGTFTGTPHFDQCTIGNITGPSATAHNSIFNGTVTANAAGNWMFHHSGSGIAGATTPIFDFGTDVGVSTNLTMGNWFNGVEIRNFNNSGTDLFSISGQGQVVYAASCSGTVNQRGDWRVTNTGGVTINEDDNTSNVAAVLVDTAVIGAAGAGLTNINLPNQTMDIVGNITGNLSGSVGSVSGAVGSVTGAVGSVTGHTNQTGDSFARIGAAGVSLSDLGGMSTAMKAEILVEVNTAMDAAITELGVAAPTATPSIRTGLMLLYMALRNKTVVQTSGTDALEIYNNAGTKIAAKLLTDDGSDYTESEMA